MSICPDNVDIFYFEGRIVAIERKINYTELFPVEIILHIFSFVPVSQLQFACRLVCKTWFSYIKKNLNVEDIQIDMIKNMPLSFLKKCGFVKKLVKPWDCDTKILLLSAAKNIKFVKWLFRYIRQEVFFRMKIGRTLFSEEYSRKESLTTAVLSSFILYNDFGRFIWMYHKVYKTALRFKKIQSSVSCTKFRNLNEGLIKMSLTAAISYGNMVVVKWCAQKGVLPQPSHLKYAEKCKIPGFFKRIVEEYVPLENLDDEEKNTLKRKIIEHDNVEIIEFVVSHGISFTDSDLYIAMNKGNMETIVLLSKLIPPDLKFLWWALDFSDKREYKMAEFFSEIPHIKNAITEGKYDYDDLCWRDHLNQKWLFTKFPNLLNTNMSALLEKSIKNYAEISLYPRKKCNEGNFIKWLLERGATPKKKKKLVLSAVKGGDMVLFKWILDNRRDLLEGKSPDYFIKKGDSAFQKLALKHMLI